MSNLLSPARGRRRFLSALVAALAVASLLPATSAPAQAQSDLSFGDADVPDLFYVMESGATAPRRGLPMATGGVGEITYKLRRFSDAGAVGSWVGWSADDPRGIAPELGAYRYLTVQYTAQDESGTIVEIIFVITVGPPAPYPVTTYSGANEILVQVPTSDIPANHDVQIRRSSDGSTYGPWVDATLTEDGPLSVTTATGVTPGDDRYFQLRYSVDSGGTTYYGPPSRPAYGRRQDPNNAPVFDSGQANTLTLNEGDLIPDVNWLTITATDPQGGAVTYTSSTATNSGPRGNNFIIDRNTGGISVAPGANFMSNNAFANGNYTVTVTATDPDGDRATKDVTITTAGNPATEPSQQPVFSKASYSKSISESDLYPGAPVDTFTASDPLNTFTILYGLGHNSTSTTDFAVNRTTGRITVRPGASFVVGQEHRAVVVAANGLGQFATRHVTLTVTADPVSANDQSPVFAKNLANERIMSESMGRTAGASLGGVIATDPQGDTVTYRQWHKSATGHFAVDSSTGEITVRGGAEFTLEQSYDVVVIASDPDGNRSEFTVTITVVQDPLETDPQPKPKPAPNQAPVFASDLANTVTVEEIYARTSGYVLATVTATDPDGDPVTYSRHDNSHKGVEVHSNGAITVSDPRTFVAGQSYTVIMVASDNKNASSQFTLTVTVIENQPGDPKPPDPVTSMPTPGPSPGSKPGSTPGPTTGTTTGTTTTPRANRAPVFNEGASATRSVAENAVSGTPIDAPVTASDADNDTITYTLGGVDAETFDIDAATGQLMTRAALDFERKTMHTVEVTATDPSGAGASVAVTIAVIDVDYDCSVGIAVADTANTGLMADCEALLEARDKLQGDVEILNWSVTRPIEQWDGIRGRSDALEGGRVTKLYLHRMDLSGTIAPEFGDVSELKALYLHGNDLTGEIPGALNNLSKLERLYVYENELTSISSGLGAGMAQLRRLLAQRNSIEGSIPAGLGSMPKLDWLRLDRNRLTGTLPSELGNLSTLRRLYLYEQEGWSGWSATDGGLTGGIPASFGNLTSLEYLAVHRNNLSGPIPPELANLSNLKWLGLYGNGFSGRIPSGLGSLSDLEQLYLHDNDLSGPIPASLGSLGNLTSLWLRDNRLTGEIPADLGNLDLNRLRISGNTGLTGCVPAGLVPTRSLTDSAGNVTPPSDDIEYTGLQVCPN